MKQVCVNNSLMLMCYRCACSAGYTGLLCEADVNECLSTPCLNGGTCNNLLNKFSCRCPPSFSSYNCKDSMIYLVLIIVLFQK